MDKEKKMKEMDKFLKSLDSEQLKAVNQYQKMLMETLDDISKE